MVVRNARLPRADSWLLSIARFLLLHACFKDAAQLEHVRHGLNLEGICRRKLVFGFVIKNYIITFSHFDAVDKVQNSSRQDSSGAGGG